MPGVLGRRCRAPADLPPHQALIWPQRVAAGAEIGGRFGVPHYAIFAHLFEPMVASALTHSEGSVQQVPRSNTGAQGVVRVGGAFAREASAPTSSGRSAGIASERRTMLLSGDVVGREVRSALRLGDLFSQFATASLGAGLAFGQKCLCYRLALDRLVRGQRLEGVEELAHLVEGGLPPRLNVRGTTYCDDRDAQQVATHCPDR